MFYPFSALKMKAECSPETPVSTYGSTRRGNPEDERHLQCREKKSRIKSRSWKFLLHVPESVDV
jgi:hypothetical protein